MGCSTILRSTFKHLAINRFWLSFRAFQYTAVHRRYRSWAIVFCPCQILRITMGNPHWYSLRRLNPEGNVHMHRGCNSMPLRIMDIAKFAQRPMQFPHSNLARSRIAISVAHTGYLFLLLRSSRLCALISTSHLRSSRR